MFGFNWLLRRIAGEQRNTFRYWDGGKLRAIDPMVAYRGLSSFEGFDWDKDPIRTERGDDAALSRTVAATRTVFGIATYSESSTGGLTEDESLGLLISFVEYMIEQKKNGSRLPILPASMATEPSAEKTDETTNVDSDATSTVSDSETDSPTTSAQESA